MTRKILITVLLVNLFSFWIAAQEFHLKGAIVPQERVNVQLDDTSLSFYQNKNEKMRSVVLNSFTRYDLAVTNVGTSAQTVYLEYFGRASSSFESNLSMLNRDVFAEKRGGEQFGKLTLESSETRTISFVASEGFWRLSSENASLGFLVN